MDSPGAMVPCFGFLVIGLDKLRESPPRGLEHTQHAWSNKIVCVFSDRTHELKLGKRDIRLLPGCCDHSESLGGEIGGGGDRRFIVPVAYHDIPGNVVDG